MHRGASHTQTDTQPQAWFFIFDHLATRTVPLNADPRLVGRSNANMMNTFFSKWSGWNYQVDLRQQFHLKVASHPAEHLLLFTRLLAPDLGDEQSDSDLDDEQEEAE